MSIQVFQRFYSNLVQTLPMNNATFTAELYSHNLFPDDLKESIESVDTSAKKASYFLDNVIKPSVSSGIGSSFDKLLNVMESSGFQNVTELAKLIRNNLDRGLGEEATKSTDNVFDYQRLFHTDYSFPEEIYDSVKFIVTAVKAPPPSTVKKEQRDTANVSSKAATSDVFITPEAFLQTSTTDIQPEEDAPPNPPESIRSPVYSEGAFDGSPVKEEDNLLEVEDVTAYLKFNEEDGGGYSLLGGPVDALITFAAALHDKADKHYTEAFLQVYPTFVTHQELFNKLVHRLEYFFDKGQRNMWTPCASLLVRVLQSLKTTLSQDSNIKIINLVYKMLSVEQIKFAQLFRDTLIAKLKQLIPDNTALFIPAPKIISAEAKKHSIFHFKPESLAKQMTLLDAKCFYKLDIYEMLCWSAEADEKKCPKLTKFTKHFNTVSQWTKTLILDKNLDKKGRESLVLYLISLMKKLRQYNNFNGYLAILSAIESAPVSRLEWSEKVIKNLEEPRALIDNKGSFKAYRNAFAAATSPCIPYIGLFLQDLVFIGMVDSRLEDDKSCINFNKCWKQFNTVDKVRLAQTKKYNLENDYEVLAFFNEFEEQLSDKELYKISLEIKPRQK